MPALVERIRSLLGPEARFLQHTDLHVGFSAVNWHRDNVNRRLGFTDDWDESVEPYRLARVGFYLQSHAESGFALGLVPGSHRRHGALAWAELDVLEWRTTPCVQAPAMLFGWDALPVRAESVTADSGDAVIFDPRILQSGRFTSGPKYSVFLAYGVEGRHYGRHRHYYRHVRRELGYAELEPGFASRLAEAGLLPPSTPPPPAPEPDAYRPGLVERLLGRRVRPRLAR